MSVRSADTERERRRALTALVAAYPAPASPPWSSTRKTRVLDNNSSSNRYHRSNNNNSNGGSDRHHLRRDESKGGATTYDGGGTATTTTTLDGSSDALAGVTEQVLSWSETGEGRGGRDQQEGLDMCASTWKSVESMARTLAAGKSVVSTIVKCYSMPSLGRRSDRGSAARRSGLAATEMMHTSLLSERLAADALTIFRRLALAPPTQPDGLYINSSKIPEAAKTLDPGLDDATVAAWMTANGFHEGRGSATSASAEALSWTEYRRALSELCPAFRRFGISTCTDDAPTTPARRSPTDTTFRTEKNSSFQRRTPSKEKPSMFGDGSYCTPWDTFGGSAGGVGVVPESVTGKLRSGSGNFGTRRRGSPPRSPGADSFNALRRKRHAAVSLDYEAITKELPQVMPPLDPCILLEHIKAQGRRDRKNPACDIGGSTLSALGVHERLLHMTLQKAQVVETANPRLVQPRHAAVKIRTRRTKFNRRREAEAGLTAKLARNAGVISRNASVAEAQERGKRRHAVDHERVESRRSAESRAAAVVRAGAEQRTLERRSQMETLKSCISDQLQTIENNEARRLARVREGRHVLHKGDGSGTIEAMNRAHSLSSFERVHAAEHEREPCLMPTIPPPDEDARWVYSSGQQLGLGSGSAIDPPLGSGSVVDPLQGSTPPPPLRKTLSSLSLGSSRPPSAEAMAVPVPVPRSRDAAGSLSREKRRTGTRNDTNDNVTGTTTDARKGRGRVRTKGSLELVTPGDAAATTTDQQQKRPFQKLWREQIRKHRYHAASRLPRAGNQSAKSPPAAVAAGTTTEERAGFGLSSSLPRSPVSSANFRARGRGDFGSGGSPRSVDWDSPAALSLWGGSLSVTPWHREGASPVGSDVNGSRGFAGGEMGAAGWAEHVLGIDL